MGRIASVKNAIAAWAGGVPRVIATRWPAVKWASHGMLSLVGALVLSLVLIAGLALGPLSPRGARATAAPSAANSASAIAGAGTPSSEAPPSGWDQSIWSPPDTWPSPTGEEPTPTDSPNANSSAPPGTRKPGILAHAKCAMTMGSLPIAVSGNTIYAGCDNDAPVSTASPAPARSLSVLRSFDAGTGRTIATYDIPVPDESIYDLVVDNGLWYSTGPFCFMSCPPSTPHVYRMDPDSHKVTFKLTGWEVTADGLGAVWAERRDQAGPTLMRIDPITFRTTEIPWSAQRVEIGCGALWGFSNSSDYFSTTIARVDPNTGKVLAIYAEPGHVYDLKQTSDGCWASEELAASAGSKGNPARFVKIGPSGIEATSPVFDLLWGAFGLRILDGTFWVMSPFQSSEWTCLQRLDPSSWQLVGTNWALLLFPPGGDGPAYLIDVFAVGVIWAMTESGAPIGDLWRLDIQIPQSPSPSPTISPTLPASPSAGASA